MQIFCQCLCVIILIIIIIILILFVLNNKRCMYQYKNNFAASFSVMVYYPAFSVSVWQGIRPLSNSNYLFCGTGANKEGIIYIGNAQTTSTVLNVTMSYPNAATTSIYGPNYIGNNIYNFVGTYTPTTSSSNLNYSFIYTGSLGSSNINNASNYSTINLPSSNVSFAHSVMNGLCVINGGNTANGNVANSYIYNINTRTFTQIKIPKYKTVTAYGIYYNEGVYTIVGGCSAKSIGIASIYVNGIPTAYGSAYILDYNSTTGKFSNFTILNIPGGGIFTHIQGICYNGKSFSLSMDTVTVGRNISTGYFGIAERGTKGFVLNNYVSIGNSFTANSVADNVVCGIVRNGSSIKPYQAVISS